MSHHHTRACSVIHADTTYNNITTTSASIIMVPLTNNLYTRWLHDRLVPVVAGYPCYDEDTFSENPRGPINMHAVMLDLVRALNEACNNDIAHNKPSLENWKELAMLDYSNLDRDSSELAKALLVRGNSGVGNEIHVVRQFFMNLVVSDPYDALNKQLNGYLLVDNERKSNMHVAYDAAVEILGSGGPQAPTEKNKGNDDEKHNDDHDDAEKENHCPTEPRECPPTRTPAFAEIVDAMYNAIDPVEFMEALQDTGEQKPKKNGSGMVVTFLKIDAQSKKMLRLVHASKYSWMPKNPTAVKMALTTELLFNRKHVEVQHVHKSAAKSFVKANPNSKLMFVFYPELDNCTGLKSVLLYFLNAAHTNYSIKKQSLDRTPNDALRVVSIMLDEKYRTQTTIWLSNKKDRQAMDQCKDPNKAMIEAMVADFNDPKYIASSPANERLVVWDTAPALDPNDVSISCSAWLIVVCHVSHY